MFVQTKMRLKEGTKIKLQRDISQIGLQVVYCRLFAGVLQVVCKVFATFPVSMLIPLIFLGLKKKTAQPTARQMDQWMD